MNAIFKHLNITLLKLRLIIAQTTKKINPSHQFNDIVILIVMIHSLTGRLKAKYQNAVLVETGGLGFKVFVPDSVLQSLPANKEEVSLFTYLYLREDNVSLYGFLSEKDLELFSMLNAVAGIGPKTALSILGITTTDKLAAAIQGGHVELLTKVSGIGRKTAERIVLELKEKIQSQGAESGEIVAAMESDADVVSALQNLGYSYRDAKDAMQKIPTSIVTVPDRLKAALRLLKK